MRAGARTVGGILAAAAARVPVREALVFPRRRLTFAELSREVERAARSLRGLGCGSGTPVGVLMPNCVDHVVLFLATASIGAIYVPVNTRFRGRELAHVIADAELRVLLTTDAVAEHVDFSERLSQALPGLAADAYGARLRLSAAPQLERVLMLGEASPLGAEGRKAFAACAEAAGEDERRDARPAEPEDPVLMLYTSGTTAMPKGCPLRHRQMAGITGQIADRLGVRDGDRIWNALPMFHASSLLPMLAGFHRDSAFLTHERFDPEQALEALAGERATLAWPAYTTIWKQVLDQPGFEAGALPGLRAILCVGPPETLESMERSLPQARILSCYGITEASGVPVMCAIGDPAPIRHGTCGLPFDGVEAEVRDQAGGALAAGERGLLWLRGAYVIDGYWRDPEKTAEAFDEDGWFCTGDVASLDADGRIRYHGREKDMLKVGGENVAAIEVEAFLMEHPAVKLAAVVGVPDPKYVEVPAAFVEPRAGAAPSERELIEFCRAGMAGFKVPRYVRLVDRWPMSATKIRKEDLRERLCAELAEAGTGDAP